MKQLFRSIFVMSILVLSFPSIGANSGKGCASQLVKLSSQKEGAKYQWRKKQTYAAGGTQFVLSTPTREKQIKELIASMESDINQSATPAIDFVPAQGTRLTDLGDGPTDSYGQVSSFSVSGESKKQKMIYGTVLLPVSGHNGVADALRWAKQDTLNLYYVDENGNQHDILAHRKSLGLVTVAEVAIPYSPGKRVRLEYYRDGSAGVSGFRSGRVIQFR